MLIPCFTWGMLIILAYNNMERERFLNYLLITAIVCAIGSAVLVPGGIYNIIWDFPDVKYSVINIIISVLIMSFSFYVLLRRNNFPIKWWWAYNILICINMAIFYFVAIH